MVLPSPVHAPATHSSVVTVVQTNPVNNVWKYAVSTSAHENSSWPTSIQVTFPWTVRVLVARVITAILIIGTLRAQEAGPMFLARAALLAAGHYVVAGAVGRVARYDIWGREFPFVVIAARLTSVGKGCRLAVLSVPSHHHMQRKSRCRQENSKVHLRFVNSGNPFGFAKRMVSLFVVAIEGTGE